ncbi:MAG TPA: CBS domain-containing protein [Candidatus Avamphibacillus sp.]|nr:CBS domain-containing protein [Candidatus Avamphibacillus sp.]
MKAHEIMKTPVIKVEENETLRAVVKKFIQNGISGLPIVNENDEMVGYISDGDIMRYIGKHKNIFYDSFFFFGAMKGDHEGFEQRAKRVIDLNVMVIAKENVITTNWDTDVEDIAALLGEKQIKKLPVERDGKIVGIVSRGDVIRRSFESIL